MTQSRVTRGDGTIKSVVIHRYDALDRRVSKDVNGVLTSYAYDNEDIIVEFGENDTIKAVYLHGPGIDEPIAMARDLNNNGSFDKKEIFYYSKDHLNSVHDLTNFEGRLIQRYNYSAYGKTKIEKTDPNYVGKIVSSPYGYTSREWDQETGDYYYRARFYDPRSARFISEDPIGFASGDSNFYRYVENNPIILRDPNGKSALYRCIAIGIGLIGGWRLSKDLTPQPPKPLLPPDKEKEPKCQPYDPNKTCYDEQGRMITCPNTCPEKKDEVENFLGPA